MPTFPWQLNKPTTALKAPTTYLSPQDFGVQAAGATNPLDWKQLKAAWQRNPYRQSNPADWRNLQNTALYGNPIAAQADTATAGPRRGLLGRVKQATRETPAFSQPGRLAMAKIAAFVGGASALGAASGGWGAGGAATGGGAAGGAGGYAGETASALAGHSAGTFGALGAGGAVAPAAAGGTLATTTAATPWYNTFAGQAGISGGLNLLSGYLGNKAQSKADSANRKAIEDRIRRALANLSPEHIMALAQQFLPQMSANMNQAGQTAIQAVREQAARTGQLESPRALNFEAGTRAKLANDVQQQAFDRAFGLAGNQAGVLTGMPVNQVQPQMGYANALTDSVNQAYFARAMSQQGPPQQPAGVPWVYPGYAPGVPTYRSGGLY